MTVMEFMEGVAPLLEAIAWPLVATFVAVRFRKNVGGLIDRMVKAGPAEFEPQAQTHEDPPALLPGPGVATGASADAIEALRTDSVVEIENRLKALPMLAEENDADTRATLLLTVAAIATQNIHFRSVETLIWRSQIAILELLSHTKGAAQDLVQPIYESASERYPDRYATYPFESYMNFLEERSLIEEVDSRWQLRPAGRDYLEWRVVQRSPPPLTG